VYIKLHDLNTKGQQIRKIRCTQEHRGIRSDITYIVCGTKDTVKKSYIETGTNSGPYGIRIVSET
jgi:hypothetical protein